MPTAHRATRASEATQLMLSRTLPRRLVGTTVALILLTGLLAGTAIAKPPKYGQFSDATPNFVSFGGQVRFDVEWTNESGANLPTVFTSAETPEGADLIGIIPDSVSQGSCDASGEDLTCAFGTVNNLASVSFAVVYEVPSAAPPSTFSVKFTFTAQGNTGSDQPPGQGGGGQSRGDDMPITASVPLTGDPDEGGTYVFGDITTLANNQSLHKTRNPQSALLDFLAGGDQGFGATLDEAGATAYPCPGVTTCYGLWNLVSVDEGTAVEGGFETVLGYSQVPGNAVGGFVHWLTEDTTDPVEGTDYELITDACEFDTDGAATNMPCIAGVTKVQGNTFFTILSETNGPMRGY